MKKSMLILSTFLFAVVIGTGIAISFAEDASACICEGPFVIILSCDTGPNCISPIYPYYAYAEGHCGPIGNPCQLFAFCHNGIKAGC